MQSGAAVAPPAIAVTGITGKTRTFFRKRLNPDKQRRIEGQSYIDDVASELQALHDAHTEHRMWLDQWSRLNATIRPSQKSRAQADVALLLWRNAFEKARAAAARLSLDCLRLPNRDDLYLEQYIHERLQEYRGTARFDIYDFRPKTAHQRDLLDLKDCVSKMQEHNYEMLGLCTLKESQSVDEQSDRTEQRAQLVLNDDAVVNLDSDLLSPRTIYQVNGRAQLNLGSIGGREETRTTKRSSESISNRPERKSTPDDMPNTDEDGKSVVAEVAGDENRAAPPVGTDELATLVGSQLSINKKAQTSRSHSSTAMTRPTAQDGVPVQPNTLSTYQDDMSLVPKLLPDPPAQRETLQPAIATMAETAGKVMATSSTNTPDPTAVMVTAGFAAGATGVNALATAINGNGTRKAAHRSARAAEKNASYANTLMGLSLTEHDWKLLAIEQAAEEHAWKREEHRWKREEYLWKPEDRELQVRKTTLECRKLERELDDTPSPGTDGGAGAASEDSSPGDLPRLIGAPPPPGAAGNPYTHPRAAEDESEDGADDGDDIHYPPHLPAPWIEADKPFGETGSFRTSRSIVLNTHDLSDKEFDIDVNVDGMASQLTTPIDQAEAIDDPVATTAVCVESNTPSEREDQRPSTTLSVVVDGAPVKSTVSLPSRPDPVACKSPNHTLARRSSENFGENYFEMDNLSHGTAKIMEISEDSPSPSKRVPVLAG